MKKLKKIILQLFLLGVFIFIGSACSETSTEPSQDRGVDGFYSPSANGAFNSYGIFFTNLKIKNWTVTAFSAKQSFREVGGGEVNIVASNISIDKNERTFSFTTGVSTISGKFRFSSSDTPDAGKICDMSIRTINPNTGSSISLTFDKLSKEYIWRHYGD